MMSSRVLFRAVLCLSTALMMVISWPLWVTGGAFPRVPWIGGLRLLPAWASWVRFAVAIAAMIAASWPESCEWSAFVAILKRKRSTIGAMPSAEPQFCEVPRRPRFFFWKTALIAALLLSLWMVLEDQFRLQPWMYQFLLMGFALAACPPGRASTLCRWFVIAQYLHSGLSKLDHEFMYGMGRSFLVQGTKLLGLEPPNWTAPRTTLILFAMPCWELGVAVALAFRARRLGLLGAVVLHAALIMILGPWGMNHSANVVIWNDALLAQVVFLFGGSPRRAGERPPEGRVRRLPSVLATAVILAAVVLPLGERSGYWDTWPSFALYSSSNERTTVELSGDNPFFPFPVLWNGPGLAQTNNVDLRTWSLRERRVPVYPSARALNGVAEALGSRYLGQRTLWVAHEGHADRRTGERQRLDLTGLDAVRRHGDTFWINAHPAR